MTAESAKQIVGEAASELWDVVRGGFSDYTTQYQQQAHKHHARSRACLIHDHMVSRAKELAARMPQLKFISRAPRNFFDLKQEVLVQFKKLDRKLLTKNKETQLSLALEDCPTILSLPGIPPKLPLLTVGYVPSHDHSQIDGIFITYVERRKLKWYIPLTGNQNSIAIQETDEQITPATKRVHAKGRRQSGDGRASGAV